MQEGYSFGSAAISSDLLHARRKLLHALQNMLPTAGSDWKLMKVMPQVK
jgi:hypothetical protein